MNDPHDKKLHRWWRTMRRSRTTRPGTGNNAILARFIAMIGARIAAEWIKELVVALWKDIDQYL